MRKPRRLILAVLGAAFLTTLVVFWITAPRHPIGRDGCEAIQLGMTEREVEAILGGPAGDYTSGRPLVVVPAKPGPFLTAAEGRLISYVRFWKGDAGEVSVGFDRDGQVSCKRFDELTSAPESLLAKLRRWLGIKP